MFRISKIEIFPLELPFRHTFSHSLASRTRMSSVMVRMVTEEGLAGFGEGCPREYVTGESLSGVLRAGQAAFRDFPAMEVQAVEDLAELLAAPPFSEMPALRCATEMAMLDLLGKASGKSVGQLLGPPRAEQVRYSGVLSGGNLANFEKMTRYAAGFGFAQVKLKVGPDASHNLAVARTARELLGPGVEIRADANCSWSPREAPQQIEALSRAGVRIIEQPLPAEERDAYRILQGELDGMAEIVVDESLISAADADWFLQHGGADRFLIKISKQGGLIPAIDLAQKALAGGIKVHLGCHVGESSLLSAAGLVFAGQVPTVAIEGAFGTLLLEEDVCKVPLQFGPGGWLTVNHHNEPGWGIPVDNLKEKI